jgi:hypothetical protein
MGTSVSFSSPINCAVTPPGGKTTATTQCGILSASANVTASISADTSAGALTVLSVTSFVMETQIESGGSGEGPGGKPLAPVKIQVPVQVNQSNGVVPLAVVSGQYVMVTIQFAPNSSTLVNSTATLLVNGDTWDPVSIPITATVGKISVKVPAIFVDQGKSVTVDFTVNLVAGDKTNATLLIGAEGSAAAANVSVTVNPSKSLSLIKGTPVPATLKVTADSTLADGQYAWSLSVWAYGGTLSFSVPVTITVGTPSFFIKNILDGNVITIAGESTKSGASLVASPQEKTDNSGQLWNFVPDPAGSGCFFIVSKLSGNVIDIRKDSTASGAQLDAWPKKDGADNQLWYFVSDPAPSGDCFIVSKLDGKVIDVGASTPSGVALEVNPVKFTGLNTYSDQLWTVVKGKFPWVVPTVPTTNLSNGNNYFIDSGGEALYGVSVTIKFTSDFISTANGYSFQLNCYSTEPETNVEWQQFSIYAAPGDTQLVAIIDTWTNKGTTAIQLNNITASLANLPTPTIPKGYTFNITLTYLGDSALLTGAMWSVTDSAGNSLGTTTLTILGNSLLTTGAPATEANLAPIASMQLNIGGDYNFARATLAGGAGTVTYAASVPLSAQGAEPSYADWPFGGTGETVSSLTFGYLPWPWSPTMADDEPGTSIPQLFQALL